MEISVSPELVLGTAAAGWLLAVLFLALWWSERDRRMAAERTGRYQVAAIHKSAETAETRTKVAIRKEETQRVKALADELEREARQDGKRFTRTEIEAEARRMMIEAGTGVQS